MVVGSYQCRVRLPAVHSLKEKRSAIARMARLVQSRLDLRLREVGDLDSHDFAVLGTSSVDAEANPVRNALGPITALLEGDGCEVVHHQIEVTAVSALPSIDGGDYIPAEWAALLEDAQ